MYVDPQKARQERERQERERQARIEAERKRQEKIKAEEARKAKAERERKAKLKQAEEDRKAKLKAEQKETDKKQKTDKKPDSKLDAKKQTEPKPEPKKTDNKTPQSDKKADQHTAPKTQTGIDWSQAGQLNPIYGNAAPIYGPSASIYGQPSVPITKASQPEPKPKELLNRPARIWTGEEADPEPQPAPSPTPYQKADLSALKAEALEKRAAKKAAKEKEQQKQVQSPISEPPQPYQKADLSDLKAEALAKRAAKKAAEQQPPEPKPESSETQTDPTATPLFPFKPGVQVASSILTPGMLETPSAPLSSPDLKLAQNLQHRITSNRPLEGDALKAEAIRQTFGCSPAVAQQLLQARRKTGNIDGMFALPSFESNKFLSSTPQYQYNITLSAEEYNWYSKYANSPPALRDVDLTIKEVQQQNWQEVAQGAHEQKSALDTHRTLDNRGNYARLLRTLNQQKLGQDKVPTDLNSQLVLLSPEQRAIYERKLQTIQKVSGESQIDYLRQGIFDQVQFETRLDVMEIAALGRSLDDKRRKQLEALYQGKSDAFKDKAEQSVSTGFNDRWGVAPVFGKETSGKVKRTLRDRYLVQSDRRAMEIVYLGRPLNAEQRFEAEAFYKKLSPEQKQAYTQKVQAEFALMWGSDAPNEKVSGQMKWVLRAQQMEKDYPGQVYRGAEQSQSKPKAQQQPQGQQTQNTNNTQLSPGDEPKGIFDAEYSKRYYQTLWNQGNQEHNPLKLLGGTLGGGITNGYLGLTGLAEQGVKDSLDLAHQGKAEGGWIGNLKMGLGYGLTFIPSQLTQERAPGTMIGLATIPLAAAGATTKVGQIVLSNPVVQRAVLPAIEGAGALFSGKQLHEAVTDESLSEEEKVSRFGQGVLGLAGTGYLLKDKGKQIIQGAQAIPGNVNRLTQRLTGQTPDLALPGGVRMNPALVEFSQPVPIKGATAHPEVTVGTGGTRPQAKVEPQGMNLNSGEVKTQAMAPQVTTPKAKTGEQTPDTVGVTPQQAQRFEQIMALSKGGNKAQAAQSLRDLKGEVGPEQYQVLQQQYLASRQGSALQGYQPQAGQRSTTQVDHKIQSSATRLFPGKQSEENCGLQVCQQLIRASTGAKNSEAEMAEIGKNIAGYDPEVGTPVNQIPNLLRNQGVGANTYENTPDNIQIGIENGQGVLSNHDAGLLQTGKPNYDPHAVHVTDVVKNGKGEITHYVINDTGSGEVGRRVPAGLFERSLIPNEANYHAVLTDESISLGGRTASEARRKALKKYLEETRNSPESTDLSKRTDAQLKEDIQKTPRNGETEVQMRQRVEAVYKETAQRLEKADGGHSLDRHGPDVTNAQLEQRLKTGIAPDGQVSFAPASTKFNSNENWVKTHEIGLQKIKEKYGVDLTKPPSDGQKSYEIKIGYDKPIDEGFIPNKTSKSKITITVDPITGKPAPDSPNSKDRSGAVYNTVSPIDGVTGTYTKVAWDGHKWKVVQHFPLAENWDDSLKVYTDLSKLDEIVNLP
jgi:hypothetical protein